MNLLCFERDALERFLRTRNPWLEVDWIVHYGSVKELMQNWWNERPFGKREGKEEKSGCEANKSGNTYDISRP